MTYVASIIEMNTGVGKRVLLKQLSLITVSVTNKMLWASGRQTTTIEDMAYSLMGIFGVHMALLYGEGINAFTRLQREVTKMPDD
ncbi:hypothetical protein BV22DRAFT_486348 [Leucogyrophana mollusca]|uniref:Uncharacterized protein n=1 Tax=Leucogyrophana mollusca TaxID=85980 RepID=A0ACB8BGF7_9AGAM|nr:hypothetical protein BV22DRAFT_486348 [Leucogyrophana mollusca]